MEVPAAGCWEGCVSRGLPGWAMAHTILTILILLTPGLGAFSRAPSSPEGSRAGSCPGLGDMAHCRWDCPLGCQLPLGTRSPQPQQRDRIHMLHIGKRGGWRTPPPPALPGPFSVSSKHCHRKSQGPLCCRDNPVPTNPSSSQKQPQLVCGAGG